MKKVLYYVTLLASLVLLFIFLKTEYPKYLNRFPLFAVLLLLDMYLWKAVKKYVFLYSPLWRTVVRSLYWAPMYSILLLTTFIMIFDTEGFNNSFKIYSLGAIGVTYFAKLIPVIFLFLADIIRLVKMSFQWIKTPKIKGEKKKKNAISRSQFLEKAGLIGGGLMLSSLVTGMVKWVYDFKIHDVSVKLPKLPSVFNGMRIVQLSDIHLGSWTSDKPLEDVVDIVNAQNADIIVFTGDLVNYSTDEAYRFKDILSRLKAKTGIYTILGNHDYGDYLQWDSPEDKKQNLVALHQYYKDINWKLLNNEHVIIEREGQQIAIAGVENWGANLRFPKYGDLEQAMRGTENIPVNILLSHDPSHWKAQVLKSDYHVDLTLAGHTHGMQFGIEIPGIKWSPAKWIYKQWGGLYKAENDTDKYLYVNRGLGAIGYPGRVGILPEITVITLNN
ncbi:MAG: metallophosphoesterase [Bacteroidales bacterium]|nr:metallophosphoesterase [Bacteroidales bacterium]